MTKLEVLKRCPFVRELNDEQLNIMVGMCHPEVFEVGENLSKQGRTQEKVYLIEDGLVGIYLELGPMNQRQLQSASSFEVIGWSAMLPMIGCKVHRGLASVIAVRLHHAFTQLMGVTVQDLA